MGEALLTQRRTPRPSAATKAWIFHPMKKLAILIPLLALTTLHAQNIVGDWQGTLKVNSAELRLVLHVTKDDTGYLKATLDSVDQDADNIPVTSITLTGGDLNFSVLAVHGTYQGKFSADGTVIEGTWTQLQTLPLTFRRQTTSIKTEHKLAKPSDIDGDWWGTLNNGLVPLRMVFHIINTEDGLIAAADSPDQNVKGLPVTTVTRNGSSLKLEMKQLAGVYEGKVDPALTSIEGTWTQAGHTLPLVLKRLKDLKELELRRPQSPVKPYPYREEEVGYENKPAGVKFAATLTIPQGKGPFPAVFLITGSGPQDRDESLMGHKPFLVLSDYLTRRGVVVLRADDRGFGKSTGVFSTATTLDFASDAEAALAYLKTRPEVDPQKIGLIGHSEGGVIAPMVAAMNHDVAFIVMMAGTGVPGDQILIAQKKLIEEASGVSPERAEKDGAEETELLAMVKSEKDSTTLEKQLREKLTGKVSEPQLTTQVKFLSSAWMRYFIEYDPTNALSKVTCPVLAINGEKDLQVPPKLNLPAIRKALEAAGNKNFEVDELPGLNHLFQTAKTGSPNEYGQIEETISPLALEKITAWIQKQAK
jgi:fermentation-respiration switch protein FrsA (DUF1100 family)